jgi:hypothetical protein
VFRFDRSLFADVLSAASVDIREKGIIQLFGATFEINKETDEKGNRKVSRV